MIWFFQIKIYLAAGQGIYFAADARTSLGYTQADAEGHRHMFMGKIITRIRIVVWLLNFQFSARVLVGQTTGGDQSTRICPEGYDTTGGNGIYVTYHDAQAYGEYLITFRSWLMIDAASWYSYIRLFLLRNCL